MTIVNPHTGRTFDHERLLFELEDWTKQRPVVEALIKSGVADVKGAMNLVAAIRFAIEGKAEGLTEAQAAAAVVQMLGSERVRQKIARHVARRHGMEEWEAEEGLIQMAEHVAEKLPEETSH